jgi:hypothetical protein
MVSPDRIFIMAAGTQIIGVPISGRNERMIMMKPHSTGLDTPKKKKPRPPSVP